MLNVNETVGVERTDLITDTGMPLLAIDSKHPKALDAPESLVHSSQYPLEIERSFAIVPNTSSDDFDVSDSECSFDEYVVLCSVVRVVVVRLWLWLSKEKSIGAVVELVNANGMHDLDEAELSVMNESCPSR